MIGLDTVRVWRPVGRGELGRAFDRFPKAQQFLHPDEEDKVHGIPYGDSFINPRSLRFEEYGDDGKKSFWGGMDHFPKVGWVLKVHIPSPNKLLYQDVVKPVVVKDLEAFIEEEIEKKYLGVTGGLWRLGRADIKWDVEVDGVGLALLEYKQIHYIPQWRSTIDLSDDDVEMGISDTIKYHTKKLKKCFRGYYKSLQAPGLVPPDTMRLEYMAQGSPALGDIGFTTLRDCEADRLPYVLLDVMKKIKRLGGEGWVERDFLDEVGRLVIAGKRKVLVEACANMFWHSDLRVEKMTAMERDDFIAYLETQWGIEGRRVRRLWNSFADMVGSKHLHSMKKGGVKPVYHSYLLNRLEGICAGVSPKPTAPAPRRFGLHDDPSLTRGNSRR